MLHVPRSLCSDVSVGSSIYDGESHFMKDPLRMGPTVQSLQKILNYKFKNCQLLWEAVQAPGAVVRSGEIAGAGSVRHSVGFERFPDGNRRLAIVGDVALKMALVEDWYTGNESREKINKIVSDIASNISLEMTARRHGLQRLINKNPAQSELLPLNMASTVEAIFGAIYLDSGMGSVSTVMQNLGLMPRLIRKIQRKKPGCDPDPFSKRKAIPAPHTVADGPSLEVEQRIPTTSN